jgi:hypothetical protein
MTLEYSKPQKSEIKRSNNNFAIKRLVVLWRKWLKRKRILYLYNRTWKANTVLLKMKYQMTDELKGEYGVEINKANDVLEHLAHRLINDVEKT